MIESLLPTNIILAQDIYKLGHWAQMPKRVQKSQSSLVPRNGRPVDNEIVVIGQRLLAAYYASVRVTHADVDEAIIEAAEQGFEINEAGWRYIVDKFGGALPMQISAVPEGTIVPENTAVVFFENRGGEMTAWLPSFLETLSQCVVAKMSTVASRNRKVKKLLKAFCERTGSDPAIIQYKIHNFGDRGADAPEASLLASMAHGVFFSGSDCTGTNRFIKKLYRTKKPYFSSIEAGEHSVTCMHSDPVTKNDFGAAVMGVQRLEAAVERAKRGIGLPMVSIPIDTYDSHRFARDFIGTQLKQRIINSGGVFVLRPDSGDPMVEPFEIISLLHAKVGATPNDKGFFTLHPSFRVIQGDGINFDSIPELLNELERYGYTLDNITFGMGGGMTHGEGRDFLSWSQKATAIAMVDDFPTKWRRIKKEPITDLKKSSLSGYLSTYKNKTTGEIKTLEVETADLSQWSDITNIIYYNGLEIFNTAVDNYDAVRARANVDIGVNY